MVSLKFLPIMVTVVPGVPCSGEKLSMKGVVSGAGASFLQERRAVAIKVNRNNCLTCFISLGVMQL